MNYDKYNKHDPEIARLRGAWITDDIDAVRALFADGPRAPDVNQFGLELSAFLGDQEMTRKLIPHSDPKANHSEALRNAAMKGHRDVVKDLLPHSDPEDKRNPALGWAALGENKEVIELILEHTHHRSTVDDALLTAAQTKKSTQTMDLLLPYASETAIDRARLALKLGYEHEKSEHIAQYQRDNDLQIGRLNQEKPLHIFSREELQEMAAIRKQHEPLMQAARAGDLAKVRQHLADGVCDPTFDNGGTPLSEAARMNHLDVVKELLPHSIPTSNNSWALRVAARSGYLDIVRELLPHSDARANQSDALAGAAYMGHTEVVKELLPHSDIEASCAFKRAVQCGHDDCAHAIRDYQANEQNVSIQAELQNIAPSGEQRKARRM